MPISHSPLQLLVIETEVVPNAKGLGVITKAIQAVRDVSPEELRERFQEFCIRLGVALEGLAVPGGLMKLDQVELSVELTSKGEIRLLASAAAEVKGGIKLVFKR
jgi:hypothetical protein